MKRNLSLLLAAGMVLSLGVAPAQASEPAADTGNTLSWDMAEEILTHISDPKFPDYSVSVVDYGAVPNDDKLDTAAIQKAIDEVSEKGGGKVIVPSGTFDVGAIELKSNVNLCLESEDSLLRYTTDINEENYPVVYSHWEATPIYNYSALIYAKDAENIALTGKGTLDGQASDTVWWNWKDGAYGSQAAGQELTREQNNNGVPVDERIYGDGWYLRPNFIQTINCENVLFEGVTLLNSPMWQVNPVLCTNVTVRGMTLRAHGSNTDCVDPESCNYVLIEENSFDSGDDCIAIKSGRDRDGRELNTPCQNIIIRNNIMADGHGGIAMGSEMSGSIYNVFATDNHFDSPNLTYPLRLKTNAKRGGEIANVYLRNSTIANVDEATIHGTMLYAEGSNGDYIPSFRNIVIENVKTTGGLYGIYLEAFEESPITGLVLRNVQIDGVKYPIRAMNWGDDVVMDNVTINGEAYPRPTEARILGVPTPGAQIEGTALLIGADADTLTYRWEMADTQDGSYTSIGDGKTLQVPADAAGKYLRLVATDTNGASAESIPYEVLTSASVDGIPADSFVSTAAARLASKGVLDTSASIDPKAPVTRIELARMLARMWDLTAPEGDVELTDMDKGSADYQIAAAVVEQEMMETKDGAFDPNGTLTREEMATVAMMSCGVSYANASHTYDTTYADGETIDQDYLTDVERGTTLGFWKGTSTGVFSPKLTMTYEMTIAVLDRVSDFAGK